MLIELSVELLAADIIDRCEKWTQTLFIIRHKLH